MSEERSVWNRGLRIAVGIVLALAVLSLPFALGVSSEGAAWRGPGRVAVIELTGVIEDASADGYGGSSGVRPVIEFLKDAREDRRVAAVVVRINSGGGSAAASQEVHRAITKVREAGKPVVVSMGDVAASGAFYAAVAADRILANPSTITGSIGVYTRFLNLAELADKYGVKLETVKTGPFKDIGNPTSPLTDEERAVMQSVVDDSLDQFVRAVAEGRNLDVEVVRRLADGRIYTGSQALEHKLIDGFGGLEDAVLLAAELAGLEGEPQVLRYKSRRSLLERYLGLMEARLAGIGRTLEFEVLERLAGGHPEISIRY